MRALAAMLVFLSLSGCGEAAAPGAGQAAQASAQPAASPEAKAGPVQPSASPAAKAEAVRPAQLVLEPVTQDYAAQNDLMGAGCTFSPPTSKADEWLIGTGFDDAHFKRGGALIRLKADMQSEDIGYLSRARYTGGGYVLLVKPGPGKPRVLGEEYMEQEAQVSIQDASGSTLYSARGTWGCGA